MPKKKEGRPLPETKDMKIWREEFDQLSLEEHDDKLRQLGLDDEDIDEFNEDFKDGNGQAAAAVPPSEVEEESECKKPGKKK